VGGIVGTFVTVQDKSRRTVAAHTVVLIAIHAAHVNNVFFAIRSPVIVEG
jgi:hypothetical protein